MAPYDPRAKLADSMYADSPDRELHALVTPTTPTATSAPPTPQPPPASPVNIHPSGGIEFNNPASMNRVGGGGSPCRRLSGEDYVFVDVAGMAGSLGRTVSGEMVTRTPLCSGYDALAGAAAERHPQGMTSQWSVEATGEQSASLRDERDDGAACGAEDLYWQHGGGVGSSSAADTDSRRAGGVADVSNVSSDSGNNAQQRLSRRPTFCVDGIPMFDPRTMLCRDEDRQEPVLLGVSNGSASAKDIGIDISTGVDAAGGEDEQETADSSHSPPSIDRRCSIPLSQHLLAAALGSSWGTTQLPSSGRQSVDSIPQHQPSLSRQPSLRTSLDLNGRSRGSSIGEAAEDWIRHEERLSSNNTSCPLPLYQQSSNLHHPSETSRHCAAPTSIAHSAGGGGNNGCSSGGSSVPIQSWQSASAGGAGSSEAGIGSGTGALPPSVVLFDYRHSSASTGSNSQGVRQFVSASLGKDEEVRVVACDSSEECTEQQQGAPTECDGAPESTPRAVSVLDRLIVAGTDLQLHGLDEVVLQQLGR